MIAMLASRCRRRRRTSTKAICRLCCDRRRCLSLSTSKKARLHVRSIVESRRVGGTSVVVACACQAVALRPASRPRRPVREERQRTITSTSTSTSLKRSTSLDDGAKILSQGRPANERWRGFGRNLGSALCSTAPTRGFWSGCPMPGACQKSLRQSAPPFCGTTAAGIGITLPHCLLHVIWPRVSDPLRRRPTPGSRARAEG